MIYESCVPYSAVMCKSNLCVFVFQRKEKNSLSPSSLLTSNFLLLFTSFFSLVCDSVLEKVWNEALERTLINGDLLIIKCEKKEIIIIKKKENKKQ